MNLKEAYKQAFQEEVQPLIDAGKMTVLGTVEELAEDVWGAVAKAMKSGAKKSDEKWDDVIVPPAIDFIDSRLKPEIDKIDGEEG